MPEGGKKQKQVFLLHALWLERLSSLQTQFNLLAPVKEAGPSSWIQVACVKG
jgi:hypothetical protein